MAIFAKVAQVMHRFEDGALVSALLTMLFIALMQIFLRNFFDTGFLWAESFLRILVIWVAMLGAMVATREKNHINIDALSRMLTPGSLKIVRVLTALFSAGICFTAAWFSVEYISYEYQDETIAFADVPVWVCQSILPIGFGVMAFRFLISPITRSE